MPMCFSPLFAGWIPRKGGKTQGEGVVVCKNHLVGLNRVGLAYLEAMPERESDGVHKEHGEGGRLLRDLVLISASWCYGVTHRGRFVLPSVEPEHWFY